MNLFTGINRTQPTRLLSIPKRGRGKVDIKRGGIDVRYRRLDEYGDMQGLRGNKTHYEGAYAVGAAIRSRLLSFKGEWWEIRMRGFLLRLWWAG